MRRNTGAIARRLEREHHERDLSDDVAEMTDNALWSAIYRLQSRRNLEYRDRIHALTSEQQRRKS